MENQIQSNPIIKRIEKRYVLEAEIYPSGEDGVAFAYPSFGPNIYQNVGKQILNVGLILPTPEQTVALLHAAYFPEKDEEEFQNIRGTIRNEWLLDFIVNGHSKNGVYLVLDKNAEGKGMKFNIDRLEGMLKEGTELSNGVRFSGDKSVRFAPRDSHRFGEHTRDSLAKDGYMIARFLEDGAEQAAEISTKFNHIPLTFGSEVCESGRIEKRISALSGCAGRLSVNGGFVNSSDDAVGCAFGVLK